MEEDDGVVGGDGEEGTEIGLGFLDDEVEVLATVAHLHDAHAAALVVEEISLSFEDDGFRQGGGAGGEVKEAIFGGNRGRRGAHGGARDGEAGDFERGTRDNDRSEGVGVEGRAEEDVLGAGGRDGGGGGGGHGFGRG